MKCIEINRFCKQIKKARNTQASISTNSGTELSKKHKFFPLRNVKEDNWKIIYDDVEKYYLRH